MITAFKQLLYYSYRYPLSIVLTILLCCNLLGVIGSVPTILIICTNILVTSMFLLHGGRIDYFIVLFIAYLPIELLLSNPDSRFHSWERMIAFVIMLSSMSPLVQSEYARYFRIKTLNLIVVIIVLASIGSFFCYFLGINFMTRSNASVLMEKAGNFGGLFSHSMKLAPMASLATLFLIYKGFTEKNKWIFCIAAICACSVLFSASRGAFVAMLVGILFLMYRYSDNKEHFLKIIITSMILIAITYPIWDGAMTGLEQKQSGNVIRGGTFSSRAVKWMNRINEFESSPIWGVGFSSISPNVHEYWDKKTGTVEPGTSWLAILSMTGVIGFIFFMRFFWKAYSIVKTEAKNRCIILYSFLIFFSVHLLTEGYIFAAGNPVCIIFWLILSCCYDMYYENNDNDSGKSMEFDKESYNYFNYLSL